MYIRNIFYFLILLLISGQSVYCQEEDQLIDSLIKLEAETLHTEFYNTIKREPKRAGLYAKVYLHKAKKDQRTLRIVNGYRLMARFNQNDLEKNITYLDSAIAYSKNLDYKYLPTILYVDKGVAYDGYGFFSKALDSYLKGLDFAKKKKEIDFEAVINHNIALLKRKLGKYKEAKSLFKVCLTYEESILSNPENDSIGYLVTLSELVSVYRLDKEIDSAFSLNVRGIRMSEGKTIQDLFRLNEGIIKYYYKDYKTAITNINMALNAFSRPENSYFAENYNLIDAYLFMGKSYAAISQKEQAVHYYKKIDSLVLTTNYLVPEIRETYIAIIDHYKFLGDKNNQLHYINRLLYNDSIIDKRFRSLNTKLIKDYDTPILLSEKEKLIKDLTTKRDQSNYGVIILLFILVITTVFLILNYRKRKLYKTRFEELMKNTTVKPVQKKISNDTIGIATDVVTKIVEGLNEFEKHKGFTKINISSGMLATKLNTNTKYLTKVIKYYRHKSFTNYINDLRIEYIIIALKKDQKLQKYTIKALANEAGFNSTEVFSKHFYNKTGIYPSYFIKRLQQEEK
ncbi:AraC family transcriptional regulator [Aquimarina sp. RZ0]|uniref:AraC family transcriptional regulator n=1 Tax=Aquimarina sp. RZ0 TaxID=2607730 RepID=UPI0011F3ABF3|nr:AraC family transcriptional regulator [Aquimarina sp. RZ0]KAA1242371.1 AraC family transcriptional regulator [Aquimarina sp. RZ0]